MNVPARLQAPSGDVAFAAGTVAVAATAATLWLARANGTLAQSVSEQLGLMVALWLRPEVRP